MQDLRKADGTKRQLFGCEHNAGIAAYDDRRNVGNKAEQSALVGRKDRYHAGWFEDRKIAEPLPEPQPQAEPEQESVAEDVDDPWTDWQAIGEEVVKEIVESEAKTISVNPVFDEKRAVAAVKFRPSEAPEKKEIWDNVEKDYLGRTILVSGDCYRVIDDPSAVYRDIFENFTQYMTFCNVPNSGGVELPWVADVRANHAYLQRRLDSRSSAITN